MKKNKLLIALLIGSLASCAPVDTSSLKIVAPTGAPSIAFYKEVGNANFETNSTPSNIVAMMTSSSDKDIVVIDTVSGIKAINNGAPYLLASNITFGNFFIASTGKDEDGVMNEGDKIVLFGQSQTPDLLFHYLYGNDFDANIEYVTNATAAAQCLASGKNVATSSDVDYVFLAQPALYTILNNTSAPTYGKASIYKNIQDEYKERTNNKELVQASLFVRKSDDKDYNKMLKAYLDNLHDSINEALENPSIVKESMDQLSSEEVTSIFQINSNAAKAVLEDNNGLGLGYKEAFSNKESIDNFISLFGLGATSEEIYFK
ncbi:MAG: hypothetical protein ACI4U3_04590 [Traorella sp.]